MMQEIKMSGSRIGALIGKGGETKKLLETKTNTTITIDSKEGAVKVEGSDENAVPLLRAVETVNAINRGFSPERAFELLDDEDLLLDMIDLSGLADNPRQLDRLRGRIIGKDGRAREQIEDMTDVEISVFGKTIALIGYPEQLKIARTAIDMLIEGVPHENVFAFLDKKKKESKQNMISYYY
ncbi:MAG: KH domain-containing protein [Methanoregula sp.]|nr:MAG: KH domain-containing protein [Methanoregula sp.]